jgi:hypothetical protein
MIITQPSRLTFWRFIFGVSAALPLLSIDQLLGRANALGVDLAASKPWMALISGLGLIGLIPFLFFTLTLRLGSGRPNALSGGQVSSQPPAARDLRHGDAWTGYRERILAVAEFPERASERLRWTGLLLGGLALVGFTIVFMVPVIQSLFGGVGWIRVLVFWSFSLIGMWGIKLFRRDTSWFNALIATVLCQATLHLLLLYWPRVTTYPFAMGWSETSRFYYPSLFLSEKVYGQEYPWPILHPTLHLLLAPPYWFDAPLWVHRFWRVAIGYLLVGAVVPALLSRLSIPGRATRWLVGLWMFLFLFVGPVYFHLTIPVIVVLLGFSSQNDRRTWAAVLFASIWCGWSRVNWYPMPGMIAAVLYLMEVPYRGKTFWSYLFKPALWFVIGILTAFVSQQIYIALSDVPDPSVFNTSLTSDLLWYRLWPNPSFFLGVLPGALIVSIPLWIAMYLVFRARIHDWHPLRLILVFTALLVLFLGGLVVSLKIGGGANVHNMDAYFSLLLIVFTYIMFARDRPENREVAQPIPIHWLVIVLLLINPVWSFIQFTVGLGSFDSARTQSVLTNLQDYVDRTNDEGGEILFITQRHLISMHRLHNVTLVPEYEREDLMEIAMANHQQALARFQADMENQRFSLIVVDPLNYNILSRRRSFAEENNVWVTRIMKHILCSYREEAVFPEDEIAVYVPQEGARQCP